MASFILRKAHDVISEVVNPGDTVVDATVGNGWDTAFLARCVGSSGVVIGFDIQPAALANARSLLLAEDLFDRCRLYERSHEDPIPVIEAVGRGAPAAAMFNLGYLPGGEPSVTTTPEATVRSLTAMTEILAPGGVITVVAYQGHRGARQEVEAVLGWIRENSREDVVVERIQDPEGPPHAPILFVIRKR